ncbi:MAG: hypothetical protein ABF969_04255 [Sporolactobacillus sp.]
MTEQNVKVEHFSKKGKHETFELKDEDGKLIQKFVFQFPGVRKTQELIDGAKNVAGAVVTKDYHEALMKHVIVEPKVSWEYFDEHEGYRRVMDAADSFLGDLLR